MKRQLLSLLAFICALVVGSNAFAATHTSMDQQQTMEDIRWSMANYGIILGVDFSGSNYTLMDGGDALDDIEGFYDTTDYWTFDLMVYSRDLLANTDSVAILVETSGYYDCIFVPWNNDFPPTNDVPSSIAAVTERGYLIPIEQGYIDYLDLVHDGEPEQGEAGHHEDDAACGCVANLSSGSCTTCNAPIFNREWGSGYSYEDDLLADFDVDDDLPVWD